MTQADKIAALLEREADALRRADFTALGALAEEKEKLVATLAETPVTDAAALQSLRGLAERNARLMEAVQRGLDSAKATLTRMRAPTAALDTYTAQGERARIGDTQRSLTRRA